jgi:hypothetical protein
VKTCAQHGCDLLAIARFTWPGKDEQVVCAVHAVKAREVARALGMHLQIVMLTPDELLSPEPGRPS